MTPGQLLAEARRLVEAPDRKSRRTTLDETIADWTDAEVVAALEQAAREPDLLLEQDSLAGDLLRSFSKRDPEKAMKWALEQPLLVRRKFAGHVLSALLPGRANEALAMAKAHPDVFEGKVPTNVVRALVTTSAKQGAGAFVSSLKELMADGSAPFMEFPKEFGEGFDFAAVLDSPDFAPLASHKLRDSMIQAWMRNDRDAAFEWVLENDGAGRLDTLRDPQWTYAELTGHVKWMAGKVDTLPEEQWRKFLQFSEYSLVHREGHAQLWLDSLQQPALREAFRDVATGGIFVGGTVPMERGLKALESLPDGEARLSRLETLAKNFKGYRSRADAGSLFLLRGKLEHWGADAARADGIVERLYPSQQ
ncbi:MAG: hypothetical protein KF712_21875 [Akkermansiaceae bacterium]|nr:hypothetical protein [Akkermansiaceae bacterium]